MRMIFLAATTIFFLKPLMLSAQIGDFHSGARSQAMGNASIANVDTWAVFNNIGALAGERDLSVALAYAAHHQVEGFKSAAACLNLPWKHFNFGLGTYYFGDDIYNEGKFSAGVSHKINFVSLGASCNYLQYNVLEYGTAHSWVLEMGGRVQIHPLLHFGASVFNINRATLSNQQSIAVPTVMKAGFSYQPVQSATWNIEIEKDPERKTSLRTGIEYGLVKQVLLRTGVSTYPSAGHFGIGFVAKKGNFDYALSQNNRLGLSHQVSASIKIKSKNETN
jgi:hypothetical protein